MQKLRLSIGLLFALSYSACAMEQQSMPNRTTFHASMQTIASRMQYVPYALCAVSSAYLMYTLGSDMQQFANTAYELYGEATNIDYVLFPESVREYYDSLQGYADSVFETGESVISYCKQFLSS